MKYDLVRPCDACPFLKTMRGYSKKRIEEMASGEFACHKTAELIEDDEGIGRYMATQNSQHCAGALICLEKRNRSHQMMRICERIGIYDHTKLDMTAGVR